MRLSENPVSVRPMTSLLPPRTPVYLLLTALIGASGLTRGEEPRFEWAQLLTPIEEVHAPIDMVGFKVGGTIAHRPGRAGGTEFAASNVVTQVDATGGVLWRQNALPHINDLASDPAGNIYVAGTLMDVYRYSPAAVHLPVDYFAKAGVAADGSGGAYVAKLSPSGSIQWVRQFGDTWLIEATRVVVESTGSYYVLGTYKGAAQIGGHTLPNRQVNLLLARCRPDGACEWVRTGVGNVGITPRMDLGLDQAGNVFVHVEGGAAFEGSNLPGNVPFLAKLGFQGKILWALRAPGYNGSAAVAPDGSVFWAAPGLRISRYSPDGQLLWTRQPRVVGFDAHVDSIAVDDQGDCFVAGPSLGAEISFDGVTTPTAAGTETYLVKYSAAGQARWAIQTEGMSDAIPGAPGAVTRPAVIAVAPNGGVLLAAAVIGTVAFGPTLIEGPVLSTFGTRSLVVAQVVDPEYVARPTLRIAQAVDQILLQWIGAPGELVLESTATVASGAAWMAITTAPLTDGAWQKVALSADGAQGYFRLRKP